MARTLIDIAAPRERVFAALLEPALYPRWIVGARAVRGVDRSWPRPNACFHHTTGIGPFTLQDSTRMVEADAPVRLVLDARARPIGIARVLIELEERDGSTRVVMEEHPIAGPALLASRFLDPLLHVRNTASLRRLRRVVESAGPDL